QFPQDRPDVPPRGRLRDEELLRNALRGKPFAQAVEDLPLATREIVLGSSHQADAPASRTRPKFLDQLPGQRSRKGRLPAEDAADRGSEAGRIDVLDEISRGTCLERREEILLAFRLG